MRPIYDPPNNICGPGPLAVIKGTFVCRFIKYVLCYFAAFKLLLFAANPTPNHRNSDTHWFKPYFSSISSSLSLSLSLSISFSMNFFKSVFSDDAEPSDSESAPTSPPKSQSDHQEVHEESNPNANPSIAGIVNAWSFGGLIKTLASKSESVVETYRRDLEEFSSGLRKETAAIREVAGRAVRDLPTSLEAGAAAAQESLESVGQAIDNIGSTVSEIIIQGKDSILAGDSDSETSNSNQISGNQQNLNSSSKPYSRFEAQIRAIQSNLNTYCKEPENLAEFSEWKLGFDLDEKGEEIEDLIEENGLIEDIYDEVVPKMVDRETFWTRYFYKVYKVKKAEEARAKLVKRAIAGEEEEVLSWDVDDDGDDHEGSDGSKLMGHSKGDVEERDYSEMVVERSNVEGEEKSLIRENDEREVVSESKSDSGDEGVHLDECESSGSKLEAKCDEKFGSEGKTENSGSCKDSDFSVVSSQRSMPEEEDLGWDEIEDIGSADEIKVTASGSPNRADLRKRLSAMEEEEDLGWDIEDDDEPVNS